MTPAKRCFDLGLGLLMAVLFAPLMGLIALAVVVVDGAPVLYPSERMKTRHTAFRLWKFRTMTPVAGDSGVSGGDKSDRITRTGALLRRFRLDELPQLFNIIKGDMSFVGPRPPLRQYVERFPALYGRVLQSRPGVTGLATLVYHAHETRMLDHCETPEETDAVYARRSVPAKARLDLIYQEHASVCLDAQILWSTGLAVAGVRKGSRLRRARRAPRQKG